MMQFEIRHQISGLEEEIYCFEVSNKSIVYTGFYSSKRKDVNDPFGYDWDIFYKDAENSDFDTLVKEFGEDIFDWDHPEYDRYLEIKDRYNPVLYGLLSGVYSSNVSKEHPLKISKETVIEKLLEKIKNMEVM
jgi:hypothetical protein